MKVFLCARKKMKMMFFGGVIVFFLITAFVLRYGFVEIPDTQILSTPHNTSFYNLKIDEFRQNDYLVVPTDNHSFNFSKEQLLPTLQTWNHMHMGNLVNQSRYLPNAVEAVWEGTKVWKTLKDSIEEKERIRAANGGGYTRNNITESHCPMSIRKMDSSVFNNGTFKLNIPCGLVQGSSITVIATPGVLHGNFQIDLAGATLLPDEPKPPIILHYNVRLHGDMTTDDPVIAQNTWTAAQDWGAEERCPNSNPHTDQKVEDLQRCSKVVSSRNSSNSKERSNFPFKPGYLAIATLRVGQEGFQMTVDGKHITSFAYRKSLEPWLISELRISGDVTVTSVFATGLPISEELDGVVDLQKLKAPPLPLHKGLHLFIGIISSANNFKHRMAIRRTWLQYDVLKKSGSVAARFFVGLHKNQMVNEELWNEAQSYGDIQLVPFIDYYSLLTWKAIAICIYGTNVVSAKYILKTDDDSFVRVDQMLTSLKNTDTTSGLLYGFITSNSYPDRTNGSKWYVSPEEWPDTTYPPWAHGPGYVVSRDVADSVYEHQKNGTLRMFMLEDVAMGMWIAEMKKKGKKVNYVDEQRINLGGCERDGFVIAHYQRPRNMLCLWHKLLETHQATCCS